MWREIAAVASREVMVKTAAKLVNMGAQRHLSDDKYQLIAPDGGPVEVWFLDIQEAYTVAELAMLSNYVADPQLMLLLYFEVDDLRWLIGTLPAGVLFDTEDKGALTKLRHANEALEVVRHRPW